MDSLCKNCSNRANSCSSFSIDIPFAIQIARHLHSLVDILDEYWKVFESKSEENLRVMESILKQITHNEKIVTIGGMKDLWNTKENLNNFLTTFRGLTKEKDTLAQQLRDSRLLVESIQNESHQAQRNQESLNNQIQFLRLALQKKTQEADFLQQENIKLFAELERTKQELRRNQVLAVNIVEKSLVPILWSLWQITNNNSVSEEVLEANGILEGVANIFIQPEITSKGDKAQKAILGILVNLTSTHYGGTVFLNYILSPTPSSTNTNNNNNNYNNSSHFNPKNCDNLLSVTNSLLVSHTDPFVHQLAFSILNNLLLENSHTAHILNHHTLSAILTFLTQKTHATEIYQHCLKVIGGIIFNFCTDTNNKLFTLRSNQKDELNKILSCLRDVKEKEIREAAIILSNEHIRLIGGEE